MSAETYIGSREVALEDSPFKDYSPIDFAMYYIERYGGIDGGHHKTWVLDQAARALKGSPVKVSIREWTDHPAEYDLELGASQEYLDWVQEMKGEWDEESECFEYDYDEGIPP